MCALPRPRPGRFVMFFVLAGAMAVAGCGGSTGTVTGTVTYNGQPLKGGTVMFSPAAGGSVSAMINEDGTYKADKVPVGEATVTVDTSYLKPPTRTAGGMANVPKYEPPKDKKEGGGGAADYKPPSDAGSNARKYVPIPLKYAEPGHSPLKYPVKSGSQEYNIPLTD